jgi:hypothetical protein
MYVPKGTLAISPKEGNSHVASTPSSDEIMAAIKNSGYLMEQEVATLLEQRGLHVRTSVAFEDPDEAKSREIDVTAIKRVANDERAKLAAFIELIVECKNNSNPMVFIARPKNESDRHASPQEFVFPFRYEMKKDLGGGRGLSREVPAFRHLGFDKVYVEHQNPWKAVQFCRIDRKGSGGWHANHGGLYDAIFYPMAKAIVARMKDVPQGTRPDEWRYFWLFFPLVVTSGDLFLINSAAETPALSPVDHVTFRRELKSGKLSGSFMLTFVRQQSLDTFVESVVDPIGALAADLIINQRAFLQRTNLPWKD